MPTINLKFAAIAALLVAFIAFAMHYDHLKEKVAKQEEKIAEQSGEIESKDNLIKKEREALRVATENRAKYYLQLESAENEIKTLRARVDSGSVKLRVKATCPKLPTSVTDTTGTIATSPELTEDARQDYYAHRADENKLNSLLDLCVQSMINDRASLKQDKQ